jgi:hypothetical protein
LATLDLAMATSSPDGYGRIRFVVKNWIYHGQSRLSSPPFSSRKLVDNVKIASFVWGLTFATLDLAMATSSPDGYGRIGFVVKN